MYENIPIDDFSNHYWQERNSIVNIEQLRKILCEKVSQNFFDELKNGQQKAPMALRVTPYIISLIDWSNWLADPIRRQFFPLRIEMENDHPMACFDPMNEQKDSPLLGLTHRYPNKALLLATHVCPVYCRYCTRGYAIGNDTDTVSKVNLGSSNHRVEKALNYIHETCEIEDVVISGGDAFRLKSQVLLSIGSRLLSIPHVRRIRVATKGLAILPMKITSDQKWTNSIIHLAHMARSLFKQFSIQTHFNHPNEITHYTTNAMLRLYSEGVTVRNQTVLLRGVNDNAKIINSLNKLLSNINIEPYYVYVGDMTRGAEDMRTSLEVAILIEKEMRGQTAGYNTPTFVVDLQGGGGKRDIHSYESYDRRTGIAIYKSPVISNSQNFYYFDPIRNLPREGKQFWQNQTNFDSLLTGKL